MGGGNTWKLLTYYYTHHCTKESVLKQIEFKKENKNKRKLLSKSWRRKKKTLDEHFHTLTVAVIGLFLLK